MTLCVQLYLGASKPLPELSLDDCETNAFWSQTLTTTVARLIRVEQQHYIDDMVKSFENATTWLQQPFIYNVGSKIGCGCGFDFVEFFPWVLRKLEEAGKAPQPRTPEEEQFHQGCRASSFALANYLETATRYRTVEVLVCCVDEETDPPKKRRRITPRYFRGNLYDPFRHSRGLRLQKGDYFLVRSSWTRWAERRKLEGQKTRRGDRLPRAARSASYRSYDYLWRV